MEDKKNENQVPELRDELLDAVVGGKEQGNYRKGMKKPRRPSARMTL